MSFELTKTDIALLKLLQEDASLGTAELAGKVGISQSPCWRRINRFEQLGVLKKRVAILDQDKLGMDLVVFADVKLDTQGSDALEQFEQAISKFPEVVECYTMTGNMDYMLKIITRDIRHYEKFVRSLLGQMPNVREMHSNVAVTKIKDTTELPIETQLA